MGAGGESSDGGSTETTRQASGSSPGAESPSAPSESALDRLRELLEIAPDPLIVVADGGRIVLVNEEVDRLFGYSRDAIVGQPIEMLVPERFRAAHETHRDAAFAHPERRPMLPDASFRALRRDGTEFPAEISLAPFEARGERFIVAAIRDVTERTRTRELERALHQNGLLLREIHHRVKNNLQVITSLLRLHAAEVADPFAKERFRECQTRIRAIAMIHETLYRSDDLSGVDLVRYAQELARNISAAQGIGSARLEVRAASEPLRLELGRALPLGLILNELVTNAFKHAFEGRHAGLVRIELGVGDGELALRVQDDGRGLPADFSLETVQSLGLRLVSMLSHQLDARLSLASEGGTRWELRMPFVEGTP